jgi:hypothetical protein
VNGPLGNIPFSSWIRRGIHTDMSFHKHHHLKKISVVPIKVDSWLTTARIACFSSSVVVGDMYLPTITNFRLISPDIVMYEGLLS